MVNCQNVKVNLLAILLLNQHKTQRSCLSKWKSISSFLFSLFTLQNFFRFIQQNKKVVIKLYTYKVVCNENVK